MCAGLLVLPIVGWLVFAPTTTGARPTARPIEPPRRSGTTTSQAPEANDDDRPRTKAASTPARAVGPGVEGSVVGPDDKPVAEAAVRCVLGDRDFEATTDDGGRFRFAADAVGCTAVARKRGFAASAEAVLAAGMRLQLTPATRIAGVVVGEDGAPVPSYLLGVESFEPATPSAPDSGARPLPNTVTIRDAEGAFTLEDVLPGRYVLAVGAEHHTLARTAPLEVRGGAVTSGVRIVLKHGRTVIGTVIDAQTKKPLSGALVFAETPATSAVLSAPSVARPPSGEFTLEQTCPEICTIHASAHGYTKAELRDLVVPAGAPLRVEIVLSRIEAP